MSRWRSGVRKLVLVPMIAGAFAAPYMGSRGVPTAEGCSGAGAEGSISLYPVPVDPTYRPREVSTSGLVLLRGNAAEDGFEPELPDLTITATISGGDGVPGGWELLREHHEEGRVAFYLVWRAEQPLEVGTTLVFSFDIVGGEHDSFDLEVVGEPTPLVTPSVTFGNWVDVRQGVGDKIDCESEAFDTSCGPVGPQPLSVYPELRQHVGNSLRWEVPATSGMVAWEARAELSGDPGDVRPPAESWIVIAGGGGFPARVGSVVFPSNAEQYCASLVVRDMLTGQELRSEPTCGERHRPLETQSDSSVEACALPPRPDLQERWCESHPEHELCVEPSPAGGGGESSKGDAGAAGEAGSPVGKPASPASRTSSSCQLAGPGPMAGSALLAGLGVALLVGRRRRHS